MKVNQRILILCEGVTEYIYARALHGELPRALQRSVSVEIDHGNGSDPKYLANEVVRRASKAKKERNAYDAIWLFFDHDNSPHLSQAFGIMERNGLRHAFCSVCIEHWFVLHYENCGMAFAGGTHALARLRTHWPDYHKTKSKPYQQLRERLDVARGRALTLMQNQEEGVPLWERNPYFSICELISFFESLHQQ